MSYIRRTPPVDMQPQELTQGTVDLERGQMDRVLREAFAFKSLSPDIVLDRTWTTMQYVVPINAAIRVILPGRPKLYYISAQAFPGTVYIGPNRDVTVAGGFGVSAANNIIVALRENAEMWAIASAQTALYIIDMGL